MNVPLTNLGRWQVRESEVAGVQRQTSALERINICALIIEVVGVVSLSALSDLVRVGLSVLEKRRIGQTTSIWEAVKMNQNRSLSYSRSCRQRWGRSGGWIANEVIFPATTATRRQDMLIAGETIAT